MMVRSVILSALALAVAYGGGASLVGAVWAEIELRTHGAPKSYKALSFSYIAIMESAIFYKGEFKPYGSADLAIRISRSGYISFAIGFIATIALMFAGYA